jgi:hypothetical protein
MTSGEVFLDTAAIIALVVSDDPHHNRAVALIQEFRKGRVRLVTTDDILVEVSNYLVRHTGWALAVRALQEILDSRQKGAVELVHVDQRLFQEALGRMKERPDKRWGLTDCASFIVMEKRAIRQAFTADRHFEQAGFERLLR